MRHQHNVLTNLKKNAFGEQPGTTD